MTKQESPPLHEQFEQAKAAANRRAERGTFLLGRIIVGLFYLLTGSNHFLQLNTTTEMVRSAGVPFPTLAVLGSGLLLILAGISILLGLRPLLGIAALVVFYLPVTFTMHRFWAAPESAAAGQMIHFLKNMALMGSGLALVAVPRPWPLSLDARLEARAAAEHLEHEQAQATADRLAEQGQ